jgi:parallel beta-helix repeat protein
MRSIIRSAAVATIVLFTGIGAVIAASPAGATPNKAQILYVGTHHGNGAGGGCNTGTYSTISAAVTAAGAGATVVVCPGTYAEDVVVPKAISLVGRGATINAAGLANGVQIVTSGVTVKGFTVENAVGEGILVGVDSPVDPNAGLVAGQGFVLSNETIMANRVDHNDQGFAGPEGSDSTCIYPGDCGGGIHLEVTSNSRVQGNTVTNGSDGILLTDDYGPNFRNVVQDNYVADNTHECGIVLPSHNGNAVNFNPTNLAVGARNPTMGGVYDNQILDNVSVDNGTDVYTFGPGVTTGAGAGIGLFAPFPGTAVYDNLVEGNSMSGNGLGGFAIHAHLPGGVDVNGNQVLDNTIGTNNLGGDLLDFVPGNSDEVTTGVLVYSGASPLAITIAGNAISNNTDGIWLNQPVSAAGLSTNTFTNVINSIVTAPF